MSAIITVILGFVLTGLIGNGLVQAWQQRNWLLQQRFLGHEKEYFALKDLADEIASLLGARVYHMQRLLHNLRRGSDEQLLSRVADYDDIVRRWNERLTSFYVRLPLLASYELAARLEASIQEKLARTGGNIDELVYQRRLGNAPDKNSVANLLRTLNTIQGRAINFNKDLLRIVEIRRMEVYYGEKVGFSLDNLGKFSTWQLVKALFIRDVNAFSIVRPTLDLQLPIRRR
jgi:hypothetical protein